MVNWSKVKYLFLDGFVWIMAHWWAVGLIAALLLFGFILFYVDSCNTQRTERKIENIKVNIQTEKIESNVAGNAVNQAANVSNQALENVNKVVNKPLNSFSNNYVNARAGYCEQFPEDCK